MLHIKITTLNGVEDFVISSRQLNNIMAELLDYKTKEITGEKGLVRKSEIIDIKVYQRGDGVK